MLQSHVALFLFEGSECLEPKDSTEHSDSVTSRQADFCPWSYPVRPSQLPEDPFHLPSPSPSPDHPQTGHAHPPRSCLDDSRPDFWPDFQGNAGIICITSHLTCIVCFLLLCIFLYLFWKMPWSPAKTSRSTRPVTLPGEDMAERHSPRDPHWVLVH